MARRSQDWNEGLARDLKDSDFAREFLIAALAEDIPLQVALGKVIRAYGVKEFSKKVRLPSSNILRAIREDANPTIDTLTKLLRPFKLELGLKPVKKNSVA